MLYQRQIDMTDAAQATEAEAGEKTCANTSLSYKQPHSQWSQPTHAR